MISLYHTLEENGRVPAHVVVMTNFIPPHGLPVYRELARRVEKLTLLLSTPMESNRDWEVDWTGLNVQVQRTWTFRRPWRHPHGFRDSLEVHVPRDTLRKLKELSPDVVISSELGARSLLAVLHGRRNRDVGIVLSCSISEYTEKGRGRFRDWLRRWLLRQTHAVAVNGHSGQKYLEQLGVAPSMMYRVPYTPVPDALNWGTTERDASAARRLLYVGQLIERKGIMPFARSLADWAARNPEQRVDWDVVGDGPLYGNLQAHAFPDNVSLRLLGAMPFQQIAAQYGKAGILVFPTLADEWGLVVNEAMTAGLPVLGSHYSQAVTGLCSEGETGWLFRPNVPAEIEAALDRCFLTPEEKLQEMRDNARSRVRSITPASVADSLTEVVRVALQHRETDSES